ncbi:MAG: Ig-like domain-containing protein, partial [Candidatus Methanomethylophilaceae archaeon]|nr:Ig-like domain-containing protein [Candidatus Methanomethylophilaceae archaeon]
YMVDGIQVGEVESHAYNEIVTVRERYAKIGYDITEWSTEDATVTYGQFTMPDGDVTFNATSSIKHYSVTWKDWNDSIIDTVEVEHGAVPFHLNPYREADDQYTYSFKGWTPDIVPATEDAEYTATYYENLRTYDVRYLPGDHGDFDIQTSSATYGSPAPEFVGTPTGRDGYRFVGWAPWPTIVTGNMDYIAQWTLEGYTVTYVVDDVQIGLPESHSIGDTVTVLDKYARDGYETSDWTTEDVEVIDGKFVMPDRDVTFRATTAILKFNITWKDWDGAILLTNEADWGSYPSYDDVPYRAPESGTAYSFSGWEPQVTPAYADAEYTAIYASMPLTFEIRWISEGEVIRVDHLDYGSTPYLGDLPDIEKGGIRYKFTGWTPEPVIVTGDATYTAEFEPVAISCTIVYLPGDKGTFEPQTYTAEQGSSTPPFQGTAAGEEGYSFAGWSPETSDYVTGDVEYVAQWKLESYIVTYEVDGVRIGEAESYHYGETVAVRDAYVKEGYDVSPWTADGIEPSDGKFVMPAKDVAFTAESSIKTFVITWKDWDGATLRKTIASYHEIPVYAGEPPQREGYRFVEWSPEPSPCRGDMTYTALYKRTSFTVTWKDWDGTVLYTGTADAGSVPSYPYSNPTRPFDDAFEYKFAGWSPKPAPIYDDREYSAEYSRTPIHIPVYVSGVTLDKTSLNLAPGYSAVISAVVSPPDADVKEVEWSSEDPRIATVDADGKVSAVSPGRTTIRATTTDGGFQTSCAVTVTGYEYDAGDGTVSPEQASAISSAARASSGSAFTIFSRSQNVSMPAICLRDLAGSGCPVTFAMGDGTTVALSPESLRTAGSGAGTVVVSAERSSPELASMVPSGAEVRDVSVSGGNGKEIPVTVSIPFSGDLPADASVLKDGKAVDVPVTCSSGRAEVVLDDASPVAVYTHAAEHGQDILPYLAAICVATFLAAAAVVFILRRRS